MADFCEAEAASRCFVAVLLLCLVLAACIVSAHHVPEHTQNELCFKLMSGTTLPHYNLHVMSAKSGLQICSPSVPSCTSQALAGFKIFTPEAADELGEEDLLNAANTLHALSGELPPSIRPQAPHPLASIAIPDLPSTTSPHLGKEHHA